MVEDPELIECTRCHHALIFHDDGEGEDFPYIGMGFCSSCDEQALDESPCSPWFTCENCPDCDELSMSDDEGGHKHCSVHAEWMTHDTV